MHFGSSFLCPLARQLHLLGIDRLDARRVELARLRCLEPVAQRLRYQAEFARRNVHTYLKGSLDGLFPGLGRTFLLRHLLHCFVLQSSIRTIDLWKAKSRGQLNQCLAAIEASLNVARGPASVSVSSQKKPLRPRRLAS